MIRRPPRSTLSSSSAASDVYKRQVLIFINKEFTNRVKGVRDEFRDVLDEKKEFHCSTKKRDLKLRGEINTMKRTKKALASLAIAGMVLTMVPFNAFAADTFPTRVAGTT